MVSFIPMSSNYIVNIQNSINEYHNKNSCVPDWVIYDIIDEYFDSIPEDEELFEIANPTVNGSFIIEFDPDFDYEAETDECPYSITRIYDTESDHDTDDFLLQEHENKHHTTYSY